MKRISPVIAELEAARAFAITQFAAEVNMPVQEFLEHFRVTMSSPAGDSAEVSFVVEPKE